MNHRIAANVYIKLSAHDVYLA